MTAKSIALGVNKNLKSKAVKGRWQVFDGETPYSKDAYSPQNAWYEAKIVATCPFKPNDTIIHKRTGSKYKCVAHTDINCINHILSEKGTAEYLYEWQWPEYEKQ